MSGGMTLSAQPSPNRPRAFAMFPFLNEAPKLETMARQLPPGCEFEYYFDWNAVQLRYRICEVPVPKAYPSVKGVPYTKIRPVTDWWKMLRPFVLLALGIRK
jgi:hypothetical protein